MGLDIIIIGAGIAGLATARALREEHNVTILEQTVFKTEVGAAIHLGPNASRPVLRWGCDLSESPRLLRLREGDSQGNILSQRDIDAEKDFGSPWLLNHRVTLHKELMRVATSSELGIPGKTPTLCTNARVVDVDCEAGIVKLDNGKEVRGDIIIGADGIKSQARIAVVGAAFTAKPSGHSAYRLLIDADKVRADPELRELLEPSGLSIFLGNDRKLVIYSCRFHGKDYLNVVSAVPDSYLSAGSVESWFEPGKVSDLVQCFSSFAPRLQRLLSYADECGLWQLRDQDPLQHWVKGKAVLIGDAAHPMLPHMGQGGSQAIEDAEMLEFVLRGLSQESTEETLASALQRFFTLRFERASTCQERSREQALGKRTNDLAVSAQIPVLNPMQFSAYLFGYKGPEHWAREKESEREVQAVPSAPPSLQAVLPAAVSMPSNNIERRSSVTLATGPQVIAAGQ